MSRFSGLLQSRKRLIPAAALVGVALAGWYGYWAFYAQPRDRLRRELEAERTAAQGLQEILKDQKPLETRIKALAPTFLADKFDVLSARFRDGLARLAAGAGLADVVVEHGQPQDVGSILLNAKGLPTELKRELRKTPDFEVVHGSLQGVGSLAQAYAALAGAQCQPWIHRVEGFSIEPVGKERERFKIRVNVATLLAPSWAWSNKGAPDLTVTPTTPAIAALAIDLGGRNIFRQPPAAIASPAVVVASDTAAQSRPVAFAPYEEWRLTGVVRGKDGPEAFFLNIKTNAKVSLLKGGRLLDATLIDAAGERAVIEVGGTRYEVTSGQTLSSRKPIGT